MNGNGTVIIQEPDGWLLFSNPVDTISTNRVDRVGECIREVETAAGNGLTAAGFISYEAAPALDKAFLTHSRLHVPLLWFGLYHRAEPLDKLPASNGSFSLGKWTPSVSQAEYLDAIGKIKSYISAGDTYQVNYTMRLRTAFEGDPYALFCSLCRAQRAGHCAFITTDTHFVCSASPELFFRLDGNRATARPMKGTSRRGLTHEQDVARVEALRRSEKNRAENVMIVDMVRNDLGRVALPGSVQVESAFDIERYPTVLQMTSSVAATVEAPFSEIMSALFPCASITGAPKVRTMEIIHELEPDPRGIYTGAIGYLAPGRKAAFNVAIRTVVIEREARSAEYGVGGGIVWDSCGVDEHRECRTKASVLTAGSVDFELLESILWTPSDGYFLRDKHMCRLARSAEYFGFPLYAGEIAATLDELASTLPDCSHKVRLLIDDAGRVHSEAHALQVPVETRSLRIGLAAGPVCSEEVFLYHKTTNRAVYERAREGKPDWDDVILHNERREITESTTANIVVTLDGSRLTPPVECGLLAGTFREHLLERHEIKERVITIDDLAAAEEVQLVNSVRRWISFDWADSR